MAARSVEVRDRAWRDPLAVAAGLRNLDGPLALLSDGGVLSRWSFVAAEPDLIHVGPTGPGATLDILRRPDLAAGVVGLLAYDAGARVATGPREPVWPDLMLARYPAMLAFDHQGDMVRIFGRGDTPDAAGAAADRAERWLTGAMEAACSGSA